MPRSLILVIFACAAIAGAVLYGKMGPKPNTAAPQNAGAAPLEKPASLALLKKTAPAKAVPAITFAGPGGVTKSPADFKGKIVVLNLWAPWCGPCVKELPALAALQKAIPEDKFLVVPVNAGRDSLPDSQAFLVSHGAGNLQTYSDPTAAAVRALGAYGLPVTLVIGKDGQEIARAEGTPEWATPDAIAYFKQLAER